MGIQFHYPKKVQYEKNGVCGPWFSTKDLNSYQDFENLKTTIRGMTRPLTLKSGDEQRRLDIRITDEAREQVNMEIKFSKCVPLIHNFFSKFHLLLGNSCSAYRDRE